MTKLSLLLVFICLLGLWRLLCVLLRRRRAFLISRLHPLRHSHAIHAHFAFVDFPFLVRRSFESVFFCAFAIPSISRVFYLAGHFAGDVSKRYDDTDILLKEMLLHHVDGDRGSIALRRLNFIHSKYKISNGDFLYVLSVAILLPLEWISKYGYRSLTEAEKTSLFVLWHDIGTRMGIRDIPSSIKEFAAYKENYEIENMLYAESNKQVAEMTMKLVLSDLPAFLWPIARRMVFAFLDDRLRKALGYPKQPAWLSAFAHGIIKLHGFAVSWMPPRPFDWSEMRIPSACPASQGASFDPDALYKLSMQRYKPHYYEEGYKIKELGAMEPGCLGDACPGDLLLPLSQCDNLPWPFPLLCKVD